MEIRHILFDFDGTLADSGAIMIRLYNDLAAEYGFGHIDGDNIEALRKLPLAERGKALGIPLLRIPELAVQAKRQYRSYISELQPIPGVPELLQRLHAAGVTMSILSSNRQGTIRAFLAGAELPPFAEVLSSRGLFAKHQTLRRWLRRTGTSSAEALYVGDEHRDAVACGRAGVRMAGVAWGYDAPELLLEAGAAVVFRQPAELADWVEAQAKQ